MSFGPLRPPLRETVFPARTPQEMGFSSSPPPLILSPDLAPVLTLPEILCLSFQASSPYLLPSSSLYLLLLSTHHRPVYAAWTHVWGACVGVCMGARGDACKRGVAVSAWGEQIHQAILLGPTSLPVTAPSWLAQRLRTDIPLTHFQLSLQLCLVPALRTQLSSLRFPKTVGARQAPPSAISGPLRNPSLPLPLGCGLVCVSPGTPRRPWPGTQHLTLLVSFARALWCPQARGASQGCPGLLTLTQLTICRR